MADALAARLRAIARRVSSRGLRLGPRRGEAELAAFERAHGVRLPREYRRFLLEVGDGGDGPPSYGMMPLGHVPEDYHRAADEVLARLREPFAATEAWIWEDEEERDPEREDGVERGALVLGTDGCGLYYLLIVSGAERGRIWMLSDVGVAPLEPPAEFLEWYEGWLVGRWA